MLRGISDAISAKHGRHDPEQRERGYYEPLLPNLDKPEPKRVSGLHE
jgi:hypothetical protein